MAKRWSAKLAALGLLSCLGLTACPEEDLSQYLEAGACGPKGECSEGFHCVQDSCVKSTSDGAVEADPCGCFLPESCCNGVCIKLATDSAHCGTCDNDCHHTQCSSKACTQKCEPGFQNCDGNIIGNGCEVEGDSCPDAG